MIKIEDLEKEESRLVTRGWVIVCVLAIAFFVYGMIMYSFVGDKGPPDWDFGFVEDIPGGSVYSTIPAGPGPAAPVPEPQHVSEKPALAETGMTKGKP